MMCAFWFHKWTYGLGGYRQCARCGKMQTLCRGAGSDDWMDAPVYQYRGPTQKQAAEPHATVPESPESPAWTDMSKRYWNPIKQRYED